MTYALAGMDAVPAFERLHPTLVHHLVNTLGWPGLRPLQEAAVEPVLAGEDGLLLAPTAGGKTEAAAFPLLTRMAAEDWRGLSVLYLCPLKALLNNLLPRLETYTGWLGRRAELWHGDVGAGRRARIVDAPPDLLLTTPESLEAILVSTRIDHELLLGDVRTVVVDEVHAFAGDDRGWHLLALLERLSRVAGRPIQRLGLSATVGNPEELLAWLQGSQRGKRPARVVNPGNGERAVATSVTDGPSLHAGPDVAPVPLPADIELDYVGSVPNAAKVIAALYRGEKRLVFCESKKLVEELASALRVRGVTTFLSHAALSVDERRRAEQAFAEARDCVIVSTSTLELGIDVGDLDRTIQLNSSRTVASFLQRIGRTGRRSGTSRNCLVLALDDGPLVQAAGLLRLWAQGWVEPIVPPPEPRHIIAQQLLAVCLQNHRVGENTWPEWWNGLRPFADRAAAEPIVRHLVDAGYLERDEGMLFIGPEAERRFGQRHFMNLTAVFTSVPAFTVLAGRQEIGLIDDTLLSERVDGPRLLLLGGRSWRVTHVDWLRRCCFVEPVDGGGKARWQTWDDGGGLSFRLTRAMRDVLLGADPPVRLTRRASSRLAELRDEAIDIVHPGGPVLVRHSGDTVRWWTWAGLRANRTLAATLSELTDQADPADDLGVRLRGDLTAEMWRTATNDASVRLCLPDVDPRALRGLKFSDALPLRLAEATLATRLSDPDAASTVLGERTRLELG